ncbi:9814_t:CDS:2 [Gigaspora margarita]|uniref:9814_t:CDS:1 n=1 Tax=Gigaspora margarita TaxID=4874 RepID=A0ABN7V9S1_GIGMA|nr:9814_t:CDS:2 [Gigaspora margarita]
MYGYYKVTFDGVLKQNPSIAASKKARKKRFKNPATTSEWDSFEYESSTTSRGWDSATITSDCESIAHDSVASWNIDSAPLPVWGSTNLITDKSQYNV